MEWTHTFSPYNSDEEDVICIGEDHDTRPSGQHEITSPGPLADSGVNEQPGGRPGPSETTRIADPSERRNSSVRCGTTGVAVPNDRPS